MDAKATAETVAEVVSAALTGQGVEVDDVSVQQAGRRRLVRVFLARDLSGLAEDDDTSPVEPLSLDEVAEATRLVSDALDGSDAMGEAPYTLEVSSTGLDRPLTTPTQLRRNVGRLLKVHLADGTQVTGRLVRSTPELVLLHTAPDKSGATTEHELSLDQVDKALVQVEFSRPDRKDS